MNTNGYILWQNRTISLVATGFTRSSENHKTGDMIQTWLINRNIHPVVAVRDGRDERVCGDCPLRSGQGCYVTSHFTGSVFRALKRGSYEELKGDWSVFNDRAVRVGSYGDPAFVPPGIWEEVTGRASTWTGYTHQWRWATHLNGICMASTSLADREEAQAAGWRTFTTTPPGHGPVRGDVTCPASAEAGKRVKCVDCGLCCGTSLKAKSVSINAHGTAKWRVQ